MIKRLLVKFVLLILHRYFTIDFVEYSKLSNKTLIRKCLKFNYNIGDKNIYTKFCIDIYKVGDWTEKYNALKIKHRGKK